MSTLSQRLLSQRLLSQRLRVKSIVRDPRVLALLVPIVALACSNGGRGDGGDDAAAEGGLTTLDGGDADGGTEVGDGDGDGDGNGGGMKFDVGDDGGTDDAGMVECDTISASIRDFREEHPDFEKFGGSGATTGLVLPTLGPDGKPVHAASGPTDQTSGPEGFAQWYNDVPGVNIRVDIDLPLVETSPNTFEFDSSFFFPIDGQGWGNEGNVANDGLEHNFHFTTEIHTSFTYEGGEVFTFRGDDDLWLFVNGQLALDLGGLHPALEGSVVMDSLGLVPGETYPMDIFHAERRTNASNFRIVTNIECFTDPVG